MATFTVQLTDVEASCAERYVGDVATWLQAQVTSMAQACVAQRQAEDLRAVGVWSLQDLTAAEVAALTTKRPPVPLDDVLAPVGKASSGKPLGDKV